MLASMSSDIRARLIEAAARVLGEEGPSGLSTRKLAAELGTSTMAVYTHFGSLPALVGAVVDEGFARLAEHLADIPPNDDPMLHLAALAAAYRANALENPHLYAVMFGSASLGGYRRSGEELDRGRYTFDVLVRATQAAMDAGALAAGSAEAVAGQLWSALHGFVMLELAGFMRVDEGADQQVLWPMLTNLIMSLGAKPQASAPEVRKPTSRSTRARRSR